MAQVVESHIDVCILSEISHHNFQSLTIMKIRYFKLGCSHFHLSICVSATCAVSGTSAQIANVNNLARKMRML